ncbi:MAG: PTH1 family peptidyl-tRNA hydrolase [Phenylobacterium sp.]|jgi:PTH1 family peptidyl-tRNA hydrolase
MSTAIQLIVGLANPGPDYANTRHNAGGQFVESLASFHNTVLKPDHKYHGLTGKIVVHGQEYRLLIPTTFMNLSGKSVSALANFFKIPVESILVAHDELDLPPGVGKIKLGGGHGGHNGLKDIINKSGNNNNFYRLRIGIGHPGSREQVIGWVLGRAPKSEQTLIDDVIDEATRCFDILAKDGLVKAQQRLHSFKVQT